MLARRAWRRAAEIGGRGLDGLRGLAILAVLLHHLTAWAALHPVGAVAMRLAGLCDLVWAGVDLFFVLSGYLITGILLDARRTSGYFGAFCADFPGR